MVGPVLRIRLRDRARALDIEAARSRVLQRASSQEFDGDPIVDIIVGANDESSNAVRKSASNRVIGVAATFMAVAFVAAALWARHDRPTAPVVASPAGTACAEISLPARDRGCGETPPPTTTSPTTPTWSQFQPVEVTGSLPVLLGNSQVVDAAVGQTAPIVEGADFAGNRITLVTPGQPTLVIFGSHWAPHVNDELPSVIDWMRRGGNKGVDVVFVSTGAGADKPNWPPSNWLANLSWPGRVMADDEGGSAASAFGLPGYPLHVFIGADGKVVARSTGTQTVEQLAAGLAKIAPP